jgi:hypothetical protein
MSKDKIIPLEEQGTENVIDPREQDKKMKPTFWYDWVGYLAIGLIVSLFNVWIHWYMVFCTGNIGCNFWLFDPAAIPQGESALVIWGFFIVPFLFAIPAIIFSNMKRSRGYAYVLGYAAGGLTGAFIWDIFLGIYNSAVAGILFLIIYFIFWKIWRSFTKFKT